MAVILAEARDIVAGLGPDANVKQFGEVRVDQSIQIGMQWFIDETECTRQTNDVTLGIGDNAYDITSETGMGDFFPRYLRRARITDAAAIKPQMVIVDYDEILRRVKGDSGTGEPTMIAFDSADDAQIYPSPDIAYTMKLTWVPSLTSWAPGIEQGGGVAAVELNLPERFARQALYWISGSILRAGSVQSFMESEGFNRARLWMDKVRSMSDPVATHYANADLAEIQ